MSGPSPTNQIDYTKHRGVRHTKSGKWGAAIRHPTTKASVWLGSYKTPKEAAYAFIKKDLEYKSLAVHKVQVDYDSACPETCNSAENHANAYSRKMPEFDSARKSSNQTDYRKHRGVRRTNSGKWGAVILHPITKASVWLGTYNTPKEAAYAFMKKNLEYQSLQVHKKRTKPNIQNSGNSKSVRVGSCNSAESARKKVEFDQAEINCNESENYVIEDETADGSKATNQLPVNLAEAADNTDVGRKKSGIFGAQIYYGNSEVHVGIYSTFAELEAAIHEKGQELDSISHIEAIAKEPVNDQNPEKQAFSNNDLDSVDGVQMVSEEDRTATTGKESVVLNRKRRQSALLKNAEKKLKQSIDVVGEDLQVTKSDCNLNVEDIQVPCSSFESNGELNMGVINAYGQLVGEFSRLDDDLWLGDL